MKMMRETREMIDIELLPSPICEVVQYTYTKYDKIIELCLIFKINTLFGKKSTVFFADIKREIQRTSWEDLE